MAVDFPDDGGGRHRNTLECSLYKNFSNSYMCTLLDQLLDNIYRVAIWYYPLNYICIILQHLTYQTQINKN